MGTVLNAGRSARKKYKEAKKEFSKAVRENIGGDIALYYEDKIVEAKNKIDMARGANQNVQGLLEKDSKVRKEYTFMENDLSKMSDKVQNVM